MVTKEELGFTGLFADRGSDVKKADEWIGKLAKATSDPIAVWTAVMVRHNTVVNALLEQYHIIKKCESDPVVIDRETVIETAMDRGVDHDRVERVADEAMDILSKSMDQFQDIVDEAITTAVMKLEEKTNEPT